MPKLAVTVSIPDPKAFGAVLGKARTHGFELKEAFQPLGVATGSIDAAALPALRALPGIGSVEEERTYRPS